MTNRYNIDLSEISLLEFKENIEERDLIPSRVILKEDLARQFDSIASTGISNMKELVDALKTKSKIYAFAKQSGLAAEYLTLLCREARSYLSNPIRLAKLPGCDEAHAARLESVGIKNTRHILGAAAGKIGRDELSKKTGIPVEVLAEFVCLSDLSRAYGIGPVFARMLYDIGIQTIKSYVEHSAEDIIKIYEENEGKKADFGANEIQFSLDLAKELDIMVEN